MGTAGSKEAKSRRTDMLSGSLFDKLLFFAVPIAASSILQQLFNSVDVAVVGNFAANEAAATAAVGCNGPIINLILNLFIGLSVGANVVIANFIGRREGEKAGEAVHTAMTVAVICGIFLIFVGLMVSRPILEIINTPEDVLPYAVQYLRIYSLGMPFILIYNFGSAILRCIGDTKRPLFCLTIAGVINAVLNMFLVIVFHLDVAGVAIATVISNVISSAFVVYFLIKEDSEIRLDLKRLTINKSYLKRILKIGIPAGLQTVVFSFSNVCIQSVLNNFGTAAVAGSAISLNFENFTYFVISAFSQATVTFTSQNYGAGNEERCRKTYKYCMASGVAASFVLGMIFVLGRGFFVTLFTPDPGASEYAAVRIMSVVTFCFLANSYEISGAALRGMGYSMTPAVFTIFGTCVFRLFWAYTVCRAIPSFELLCAVYPISWIITGAAVLTAYFVLRKKAFARMSVSV